MTGEIKRLIRDRGFGFVRSADSRVEYFFHRSAVCGSTAFEDLREGSRVSFEVGDSPKGPRAEQVRAL